MADGGADASAGHRPDAADRRYELGFTAPARRRDTTSANRSGRVDAGQSRPPLRRPPRTERPLTSQAPVFASAGVDRDEPRPGPHLGPSKVGRNSPCPCGSGKKHKRCCGQLGG